MILRGAIVPKSNPGFWLIIPFMPKSSHAKSRSKIFKVENANASTVLGLAHIVQS
jgi:hypothetical protein